MTKNQKTQMESQTIECLFVGVGGFCDGEVRAYYLPLYVVCVNLCAAHAIALKGEPCS